MARRPARERDTGRERTGPSGSDAPDPALPAGFQPTDVPAVPSRVGRIDHTSPAHAEKSWDTDDPLRRSPGIEADRLGAGFDPTGVGDETGDATSPRPDENVADEIGAEVGMPLQDDEELEGSAEKVGGRDDHRWELNPASSEDYRDRQANDDETPWREGDEDLPAL